MLTEPGNAPSSEFVFNPHPILVVEAFASRLGEWVDSPPVKRVKLLDDALLDKGGGVCLTEAPCAEGPAMGPLSFDFDLGGGMANVLLGHSLTAGGSLDTNW